MKLGVILLKNLKYIVTVMFIFLVGMMKIEAKNELYSIDIFVHINQDASAHIKEVWKMKVDQGTEMYKPMGNMGDSELSNFKVTDETGRVYQNIAWDINASFQKAYKSGIHSTSDGFELCWGMSSYGKHTYTIEYDVTNFVLNTEDGQMIYWKLVNDSMNPSPDKVEITIDANQYFLDEVPVWGYGYKGYAYVYDGKIYLESENGISKDEYVVLYATFKPNTFNATAFVEGTNEDWLNKAESGSFDHDYSTKITFWDVIGLIFSFIFTVLPIIILIILIAVFGKSKSPISDVDYGPSGKQMDYKNVNYFRDLPCKKDIHRAYFVATLYNLNKKKEDFLGSIFLKWLNEEKITIVETPHLFLVHQKIQLI